MFKQNIFIYLLNPFYLYKKSFTEIFRISLCASYFITTFTRTNLYAHTVIYNGNKNEDILCVPNDTLFLVTLQYLLLHFSLEIYLRFRNSSIVKILTKLSDVPVDT